jgi:hypothetical protein
MAMAVDSARHAVQAGFDDKRYTAGWTSAAIAVHSILQMPACLALWLSADGVEPIEVDFQRHVFYWDGDLSLLPHEPANLMVETLQITERAVLHGKGGEILTFSCELSL